MNDVSLFLIAGWPGCGKSTVGQLLAKEIGAVLVDRDTVMDPVIPTALSLLGAGEHDYTSKEYGKLSAASYTTSEDICLENLIIGHRVLLVAPYGSQVNNEDWWDNLLTKLQLTPEQARLVWLYVDDMKTMKQRLEKRMLPQDEYTLANWKEFSKQVDLDRRPVSHHISIDTSRCNPLEATRQILTEHPMQTLPSV
jgi:shikimate kinase